MKNYILIRDYKCSIHFLERLHQRNVTQDDIENVLKFAKLKGSKKLNGLFERQYNGLILVTDEETGSIITIIVDGKRKRGKKIKSLKRKQPYKRTNFDFIKEIEETDVTDVITPGTEMSKEINNRVINVINRKGEITATLEVIRETKRRISVIANLGDVITSLNQETIIISPANRVGTKGSTPGRIKELTHDFDFDALSVFHAVIRSSGVLELLDGNTRMAAVWQLHQDGKLSESQLQNEEIEFKIVPESKWDVLYNKLNNNKPHSFHDYLLNSRLPMGEALQAFLGECNQTEGKKKAVVLGSLYQHLTDGRSLDFDCARKLFSTVTKTKVRLKRSVKVLGLSHEVAISNKNKKLLEKTDIRTSRVIDAVKLKIKSLGSDSAKAAYTKEIINNAGVYQAFLVLNLMEYFTGWTNSEVADIFVESMTTDTRDAFKKLITQPENAYNQFDTFCEIFEA